MACLPTWSMPSEKSHGTTVAPRSANGWLDVPVPAARSRTSSPGCGSTASMHVVAPAAVLAEGEHVVGDVVALGDRVEHAPDVGRLLVEVCAGHAQRLRADAVGTRHGNGPVTPTRAAQPNARIAASPGRHWNVHRSPTPEDRHEGTARPRSTTVLVVGLLAGDGVRRRRRRRATRRRRVAATGAAASRRSRRAPAPPTRATPAADDAAATPPSTRPPAEPPSPTPRTCSSPAPRASRCASSSTGCSSWPGSPRPPPARTTPRPATAVRGFQAKRGLEAHRRASTSAPGSGCVAMTKHAHPRPDVQRAPPRPGDPAGRRHGDEVRDLQARLEPIAWLFGDVTGTLRRRRPSRRSRASRPSARSRSPARSTSAPSTGCTR